jgi:hypothetical protein
MMRYKAATTAPVHLKICVSFLLSIMVAITVGLALRSALPLDAAIERHMASYQTHKP